MIEVELPTTSDAPELVRSFAACLASVSEVQVSEVPLPDADFRGAMAHWRSWLAGRGFGLAPLARPRTFNWPGYWLAVLDEDRAVLLFGTPAGVVLSPQDPGLLGVASLDLPIVEGFVLAALEVPGPAGPTSLPALEGTVVELAVAPAATDPMRGVPRARALAGRGLEGDRYAAKSGTFTPSSDSLRGYDLTLVESEVIDDLTLPGGRLDYADARRNVVTRGIDVNALVGRRFRIGDVECIGQRLCEPCSHLERLTGPGALRALIHRGGLRADILGDGEIEVGSVIRTID